MKHAGFRISQSFGLVSLLLVMAGMLAPIALAQELYGVAYNLVVADPEIKSGDIVALTQQGIVRAREQYTPSMMGIATDKPIIAIHQQTNNTRSIVKNGEARVTVSAANGGIQVGDFITTSATPGVGVKALESGYVIGLAKSSFSPPNSDQPGRSSEIGTVVVGINIHFRASKSSDLGNSFVRVFRAFTSGVEQDAGAGKISSIIRYVLGAAVAIVSFVVAFFFFGHNVGSSIEAMGRNPLAKSTIQFSLILNLIFTSLVVLIGLFIAFMVIRF